MTWVLVTGGAKGLGSALCKGLSQHGYNVLIHYRTSEQEAEKLAAECKNAVAIQGDFSSSESIEDFVRRIPHQVDHLINNVGNFLIKRASETTLDQWNYLFQTNFFASLQLIQLLQARESVINIGAAGLKHINYAPAYKIAKMALLQLTQSLAREGMRINMVSPGLLENSVDLDTFPNNTPIKFEEVFEAVKFLLDNRSITGQNIEVAGGFAL